MDEADPGALDEHAGQGRPAPGRRAVPDARRADRRGADQDHPGDPGRRAGRTRRGGERGTGADAVGPRPSSRVGAPGTLGRIDRPGPGGRRGRRRAADRGPLAARLRGRAGVARQGRLRRPAAAFAPGTRRTAPHPGRPVGWRIPDHRRFRRGVGLALARWLARAGAGRIVLLGRSPLPDRSRWDDELPESVRGRVRAVLDLERLGVEVKAVAADVTDEAAMAAAVREALEHPLALRGVVHAAGVSLPQFVRDVDTPTYRDVWRPKVLGGWLLHRLTREAELDFFLGFSSIAATWGSQHLASYAAGNAFLGRPGPPPARPPGCPRSPSRGARGSRPRTCSTRRSWTSWSRPELFPLAEGQCLRLLGELLASDRTHQVVCAADWPVYRRKPVMEARNRPADAPRAIELRRRTGRVGRRGRRSRGRCAPRTPARASGVLADGLPARVRRAGGRDPA